MEFPSFVCKFPTSQNCHTGRFFVSRSETLLPDQESCNLFRRQTGRLAA